MTAGWRQAYWLARYDLAGLSRERGVWWLLGVALALALFALAQGARFEAVMAQTSQAAVAQQTQARNDAKAFAAQYFAEPRAAQFASVQWFRNVADVRGYAFREYVGFAIKPALAGAALAVAQADVLPSQIRMRVESMQASRQSYDIEHPARLALGRFDLLFFVVYLWPLLLLALGTPVLTYDRETRRLATLRLQGVPAWRLLLVQVLARVLASSALLIVVVCAAALLTGAVPHNIAGVTALARWSGVVLVYSMFWAAVIALVCAGCGRRVTGAFAGFGAWVVLAILLPAVLTAAVSVAAPLPQREAYLEAMRDANDQANANPAQLLERFYDEHPQWRPATTALDKVSSSVSRIVRAVEQERVLAAVEQRFDAARARRERVFERWLWLSPVTQAYEALARAAGNDARRHQLFVDEVTQHQQQLRAFFQERIQLAALADEKSVCADTCLAGYGFDAFDAVPVFQGSAALRHVTPVPVAALLGWSLVLLIVACLALVSGRLGRSGRRRVGVAITETPAG